MKRNNKDTKCSFDFKAYYKRARKTGTLDLSNKSLESVPEELWSVNDYKWEGEDCKWWELENVTQINLSGNFISEIPEKNFEKLLPNLK